MLSPPQLIKFHLFCWILSWHDVTKSLMSKPLKLAAKQEKPTVELSGSTVKFCGGPDGTTTHQTIKSYGTLQMTIYEQFNNKQQH